MGSSILMRIVRSKLMRAVVLIVCVVIAIAVLRSVYVLSQKKNVMTDRQEVLTSLAAKNRELQEELKEATSPSFIEKQARDKLGLVREGETVVLLDKTKIRNMGNEPTKPTGVSSWKQWWGLFF